MKTIIAGSRDIRDPRLVLEAIENSKFEITEVVCGGARGVDDLGRQWAMVNDIPIKRFPADWDAFGRAAGHIRNAEMAEYADALIAVWDGVSKGTFNMINNAHKRGLTIYVYRTDLQ